tara:strand:- start:1892 stop:2302 length:411 start_codon:yes stop_codon:yes gene_type:complete
MAKKEKRIYPGELLKEARRKKRRRFKKLSVELGIQEKYLEALEENNFSIMAGPTYVKGYLRAYSKKLDLDPEIVIKAFDRFVKDKRRQEKKELKKEKKKDRLGRLAFKPEDYGVLVFIIVLIILIAVFYYDYIPSF